jgi:hypothetical protein
MCPKSDTIGETYEESGKVQVRIGKGLCDDHVIDTDFEGFPDYPDGIVDGYINFTVFDTNTPPPDYYTNPENYAFIDKNGIIIPITSIQVGSNVSGGSEIKFRLINFGDDYFSSVWNDHYTDFYKIYDIRQGYQHIPQQMSPPPMIDGEYFYYGPTLWMNIQIAVQVTRFYTGVVRVKRTNRIAVSPDYESITFDSHDRLKVNSDESLRVTGSIDQRKLRSYPIARPIERLTHYYPGEIFTNAHYDILYMVCDPNGIDTGESYDIDEFINQGQIRVFKEQDISIRKLIEGEEYHIGEIVYGLMRGQVADSSQADRKRNFTIALVKKDFIANSNYMDGLFRDVPSTSSYVHSLVSTIMHDSSINVTGNGATSCIYETTRVYEAGVEFHANQLFTDADKTGFYMAKDNFHASGTIGDDMAHILVIKSPT